MKRIGRNNSQSAGKSLLSKMAPVTEKVGGIATETPSTTDELGLAERQAEDYHGINHLSFRAVEPVDVKVRNLSITVDVRPSISPLVFLTRGAKEAKETRTILDDINADMPAGELMAIIGGSGSGKVTMSIAIPD